MKTETTEFYPHEKFPLFLLKTFLEKIKTPEFNLYPRCPICRFPLVLKKLPHYYLFNLKCAKCSGTFNAKDTMNELFNRWNAIQRQQARENPGKVLGYGLIRTCLREELLKQEGFQEQMRSLRRIFSDDWYEKNRVSRIVYSRERRKKVGIREMNLESRRRYRLKNREITSVQKRIEFWRQKQKRMLERFFSSEVNNL